MRQTKILMGMPITIEVVDVGVSEEIFSEIFSYFKKVDKVFSTYKKDSEISKINLGLLEKKNASKDILKILKLSEETKKDTDGYFEIEKNGKIDPSGIVKGWAIFNAAKILKKRGFKNFYVDAGGDIAAIGLNSKRNKWTIGIKNPFNEEEIIKVLQISNRGVATSGTYIRGQHIYNPKNSKDALDEIVSITVVGENIYEADRFATAAFAMGRKGIEFIEKLKGFEGYMIDKNGIATFTSGFLKYTIN